ncbi:RNA polymerase sigma factor [Microbacterium sp.]|uniref:RNA polymerase sigma factor n=1 Tax=Microbacterium sp. TaxID=51671 RepID=UPI0039E71910
MDETDEGIWARVVAGDARAFGVLWDRHHTRVFRHLRGQGLPPMDADDLTAATFLELWRKRRGIRFVDGSALPWIIVTARNLARNAARARRRYERFLAALPAPEPHTDVADRHDVDDRTAAIRLALADAKPMDADLLAMTALEGFTLREAAAALGLSESAAKMRLSRLRARLRASVAPSGTGATAVAPADPAPAAAAPEGGT